MKCEKCKENEATVHITKVVNGVATEMHLCEECAKLSKSDKLDFFDAAEFLSSFFEPITSGITAKKRKVCAKCGTSLEDFSRTGYFGCSDCYTEFRDSLPPIIQRMHGKTRHVGKIPKGYDKTVLKAKEYEKLKEQLKAAIEEERYEDAAKIRDGIKKLENES